MTDWRDAVLDEFVPEASKLTLVADPDALLTEERLALALRERGFDLIEFNDPVAFRYAYETRYRSLWDRGASTDLVVVLRSPDAALDTLPYDLLRTGRQLRFSLSRLFPDLSYPVVEQLDRGLLDPLYEACGRIPPGRLGDNATRDFILQRVFDIAVERITDDADLLQTLLRLHYARTRLPRTLTDRLVQVLQRQSGFRDWPLAEIVPDGAAFFAFLQERWPLFLAGLASGVREQHTVATLRYPGPERIPFDHRDIRVYIDNLFVEGKLAPVRRPGGIVAAEPWLRSGMVETDEDDTGRAARLFERIENQLPTVEGRYKDWITFALKWAELSALVHRGAGTADENRLRRIGETLNATFARWLRTHYAGLINLPPTEPAMLHHVPRHLARELEEDRTCSIALLVVDGLALDQWVTLRPLLQEQDRRLILHESATFAWIPTLTSVSRQALFSGKPPLYFPSSIHSTHNEGKLWTRFWESAGLSRADVAYQRGLGDGDPIRALDVVLHPGKTRVVGLVVDKVDKIMHGMQLGAAGMHNQIEQWGRGGYLGALIGHLLDHGYRVWLTADHGNIECSGKGRPTEGVIAETRGERVRVYPTPELRARVAAQFPSAREWPPVGLPADYFPLLADGSDAFVNPGEMLVGHGGSALEEVIVPLVQLERTTRR